MPDISSSQDWKQITETISPSGYKQIRRSMGPHTPKLEVPRIRSIIYCLNYESLESYGPPTPVRVDFNNSDMTGGQARMGCEALAPAVGELIAKEGGNADRTDNEEIGVFLPSDPLASHRYCL